jgi:predicted aspartyl protease
MSYVRVPVLIGKTSEELREVTFLVDTGASFTILPPSLARELEIERSLRAPALVADNRMVQMDLGVAYARLMDRESGQLA